VEEKAKGHAASASGTGLSNRPFRSKKLSYERDTSVGRILPDREAEDFPRGTYQIFDSKDHLYKSGLKTELDQYFGVYIFFDSRGQAIYAGKARKQKLWREMNLAFNRDRRRVQKIKRVRHPTRQQEYRTSEEKARQIGDHIVPLYEIASYFSAYRVSDGMVDDLEALLVRSFANNLLNIKMELFARSRRTVKGTKLAA
jgi:hypothetical protein